MGHKVTLKDAETRAQFPSAPLTQQVEYLHGKQKVAGSSPQRATTNQKNVYPSFTIIKNDGLIFSFHRRCRLLTKGEDTFGDSRRYLHLCEKPTPSVMGRGTGRLSFSFHHRR